MGGFLESRGYCSWLEASETRSRWIPQNSPRGLLGDPSHLKCQPCAHQYACKASSVVGLAAAAARQSDGCQKPVADSHTHFQTGLDSSVIHDL